MEVYKRLILSNSFDNYFEESRKGLQKWEEMVKTFGLVTFRVDVPDEKGGFVPNVDFYDKWYGKKRWAFSTIYSNSIGEGEIGVSPIQMANLAAIIANKGYYYVPHLVKMIGKENIQNKFLSKQKTCVDSTHFQTVIDAMQRC